jgi:gluconolactonase
MPNGAYAYDGYIYWVQEGNSTVPGGVVRMDPHTLETEVVLNNFMGHRFNALNDIAITKNGVAYFTDFYGNATFNTTLNPMITNNVYRWELATGNLKIVAGAGDSMWFNPNGIALSPQHELIYFSNRGNTGDDAWGGRTIYSYSIDDTNMLLGNRNIFAYVDSGIVDGVKTDTEGNVYAAVTGGVDVFNPKGVLLGKIKTGEGAGDVAVNMAWVDHWLYIMGRASVYRVELTTSEWKEYA